MPGNSKPKVTASGGGSARGAGDREPSKPDKGKQPAKRLTNSSKGKETVGEVRKIGAQPRKTSASGRRSPSVDSGELKLTRARQTSRSNPSSNSSGSQHPKNTSFASHRSASQRAGSALSYASSRSNGRNSITTTGHRRSEDSNLWEWEPHYYQGSHTCFADRPPHEPVDDLRTGPGCTIKNTKQQADQKRGTLQPFPTAKPCKPS